MHSATEAIAHSVHFPKVAHVEGGQLLVPLSSRRGGVGGGVVTCRVAHLQNPASPPCPGGPGRTMPDRPTPPPLNMRERFLSCPLAIWETGRVFVALQQRQQT